jgi:hypothetical protein
MDGGFGNGGEPAGQSTALEDIQQAEEGAPEQEAPEAPRSWIDDVDDPDLRQWAQSKNFKSFGEALRSARELDSIRGQQGEELAQTRQQLAEYQAYLNALQQQNPYAAPQQQGPTLEQIAQAANSGDLEPGDAIAYALEVQQRQFEQMLDQRFGQFRDAEVAPIGMVAQEQMLRNEIQLLSNMHPDFRTHADESVKLFQSGKYATLSDAFYRVQGEARAKHEAQQRRSSQAQTLDGGSRGRRSQEVDVAKLLREELMANGRADSGGFG